MSLQDLARELRPAQPYPGLSLRQATVSSVSSTTGTVAVKVGGASGEIAGVKYLATTPLVAGDSVWVLQNGPDLLVLGKLQPGGAQGNTGTWLGGLELYHSASTPHIDFHRAASAAGDAGADYDVRLINDAAGQLRLVGGGLYVNNGFTCGDSGGTIRTIYTGGGGAVDIAGWLDFHLMRNADEATPNYDVRLVNETTSELTMRTTAGGSWGALNIGDGAKMGSYGWDSAWAHFGHKNDFAASTGYAFLSHSGGETIVSSRTTLRLRAQNAADRMYITDQIHTNVRLNVTGGIVVWSDWFRIKGAQGIHWEDYGVGWFTDDGGYIKSYAGKAIYTAGNVVSDGAIVNRGSGFYIKAIGDNTHRMYWDSSTDGCIITSWHRTGIRSVQYDMMTECGRGNSTRHVNLASNAWKWSDAATHTNFSDPRFKRDMRALPPQTQRVKNVTPIAFQWDERHDVIEPGRKWFGFDATQLPPEVVKTSYLYSGPNGEPEACLMVDPMGVLAIAWQGLRDTLGQVEAAEARVAAAEAKLAQNEARIAALERGRPA